jgi:hypothetical protein
MRCDGLVGLLATSARRPKDGGLLTDRRATRVKTLAVQAQGLIFLQGHIRTTRFGGRTGDLFVLMMKPSEPMALGIAMF